jgi:hypothetical protein
MERLIMRQKQRQKGRKVDRQTEIRETARIADRQRVKWNDRLTLRVENRQMEERHCVDKK